MTLAADTRSASTAGDGAAPGPRPPGPPGPPRPPRGGDRLLPEIGSKIGQYELIRELGRGGMGAVFLARDTKLGRRVAIKFLQSSKPELSARFILEARATARCNHENIIVIHEVDEYEGNPFMVLEFLQGAELSKLLRKGRKLTPSRAIDIAISVARALERAHEHNIVHRDLKPDNIFLTDSGTVKVLDFGIAKLVQESHGSAAAAPSASAAENLMAKLASGEDELSNPATPELTRRGAIVGTLPYMSPEQWGAGTIDHRTDLWALGILLFRMVAGRHPLYPAKGRELMITGVLSRPMPRARAVCPDLPEALADVIDRCLIKNKEQRIGSAQQLLALLEDLLPGQSTRSFKVHEAPYAGLSSFQESDANRFFGRSREIAAAVNRLQKQPLLGVVGPSGVGKSSFVRAGIVPALKDSGEQWSTLVVRPGRQPVGALAQVVAPMISQSSTTVSSDLSEIHQVHERLYREPGYLGSVLRSRARRRGRKLLLFVDQFEEIYTLVADPRERMAFTRCLAGVADDPTTPLRVVISIRSDFLDRVPEDQYFMDELANGLFFLTPPSRAGLRDALIQPAEMAGYQFESKAMVEHMLDHLEHTPGALPLLQFAATKLWEMRDDSTRLMTDASYRQIGGIAGALASHADTTITELPQKTQNLARALFLRLVTPERTRAIVSTDELVELAEGNAGGGEMQRLLDRLVGARLLVVQTGEGGGGGATVEIVHESLIHSWPLLRKWLDDNQDDAVFLEELRNTAKQWENKGRPQGLLWRGEAMEEARLWQHRYRGQLPQLQQAYLDAVSTLAARSSRRRRTAVIVVIAVLVALVAAAVVALWQIRAAQKEAAEEAVVAERAEKRVRDQFDELKQAKDVAESEGRAAEKARKVAEQAKRDLEKKNVALVRAVDELEQARRKAERARRRARRSSRKAKRSAREARKAEAEVNEANEKLTKLLNKERKRVEELKEKHRTSDAIETVPVD